jgi:hypothetical protein
MAWRLMLGLHIFLMVINGERVGVQESLPVGALFL